MEAESATSSSARRRLRLDRCPRCRYVLTGLPAPGRCPECGFVYDTRMFDLDVTAEHGVRRRRPRLDLFIISLPAVLLAVMLVIGLVSADIALFLGGIASILLMVALAIEQHVRLRRLTPDATLLFHADGVDEVNRQALRLMDWRSVRSVAIVRKGEGCWLLQMRGRRWSRPLHVPLIRVRFPASEDEVAALRSRIHALRSGTQPDR